MTTNVVHVIGAGLAGCEAAWQLSNRGIQVILHEMRPTKMTPAHSSGDFAELVCSNSFRAANLHSAIGLLHEEMRRLNSIVLRCADETMLPAGGALAVDRKAFSGKIEHLIRSTENIKIVNEEVQKIGDDDLTIIASGPLTSDALTQEIKRLTDSEDDLAFFDAIAPIVYADTIDYDVAWYQSRYDKGDKDYINCPMNEEEYYAFIDKLLEAEKTHFKDWEKDAPYFDGCLPIEVMASRGRETLRFGPMKPVGLKNPHDGDKQPYAVVQLRRDNAEGSLYNIVGFQTKIKYAEQANVFRMIPGLRDASFARLGGIHRNTFLNSPKLLNAKLSLKSQNNVKFAGQITGVEGYIESAACGLLAGVFMSELACSNGQEIELPPRMSAIGALLHHITLGAEGDVFQPMNINYGLFPQLEKCNKAQKKEVYAEKALSNIDEWIKSF